MHGVKNDTANNLFSAIEREREGRAVKLEIGRVKIQD